jgi:hypothetical protein
MLHTGIKYLCQLIQSQILNILLYVSTKFPSGYSYFLMKNFWIVKSEIKQSKYISVTFRGNA